MPVATKDSISHRTHWPPDVSFPRKGRHRWQVLSSSTVARLSTTDARGSRPYKWNRVNGPSTSRPAGLKAAMMSRSRSNRQKFVGLATKRTLSGEVRWTAQATINENHFNFGTWATAEEAAIAFDRGVLRYRGPGARRNFPERELPQPMRSNSRRKPIASTRKGMRSPMMASKNSARSTGLLD
jgi:hypothetical protein